MYWVPYDGVGFICEVKCNPTKSNLEKDLTKLQKLVNLRTDPNERFRRPAMQAEAMTHQIHCLVNDENSFSDESHRELFKEYPDAWDLVLIVNEDKLYINSTLPYLNLCLIQVLAAHLNGHISIMDCLGPSLRYLFHFHILIVHTINPILKLQLSTEYRRAAVISVTEPIRY